MFKKLLSLILFIPVVVQAQISLEWTSPSGGIYYDHGFLITSNNQSLYYRTINNTIQIMTDTYSGEVQATIDLLPSEEDYFGIDNGPYLWSLYSDVNGDNSFDAIIYGRTVDGINYRDGLRIFDPITGDILLDLNDANYSYSYIQCREMDDDNQVELVVRRTPFPGNGTGSYLVYETAGIVNNISGNNPQIPTSINRINSFYPNPFNPSTTISYDLEKTSQVEIRIENINGQLVRKLEIGNLQQGTHNITWDGFDQRGFDIASGTYFARLFIDGKYVDSGKIIHLK